MMKFIPVVTLALAGVAGLLAVVGVDVAGFTGTELVGTGLVLGVVSEFMDRHGV